jgi:type II secretory pathway component GspD/PulD (secretin)
MLFFVSSCVIDCSVASETVSKVPFLGDLPLIGSLFRSSSSMKTKSELVIMITPKIMNDGEGAVADSLL